MPPKHSLSCKERRERERARGERRARAERLSATVLARTNPAAVRAMKVVSGRALEASLLAAGVGPRAVRILFGQPIPPQSVDPVDVASAHAFLALFAAYVRLPGWAEAGLLSRNSTIYAREAWSLLRRADALAARADDTAAEANALAILFGRVRALLRPPRAEPPPSAGGAPPVLVALRRLLGLLALGATQPPLALLEQSVDGREPGAMQAAASAPLPGATVGRSARYRLAAVVLGSPRAGPSSSAGTVGGGETRVLVMRTPGQAVLIDCAQPQLPARAATLDARTAAATMANASAIVKVYVGEEQ